MTKVAVGAEGDGDVVREVGSRSSAMEEYALDLNIFFFQQLQRIFVPVLQGAYVLGEKLAEGHFRR